MSNQGASLTAKGKKALGFDFRAGFMRDLKASSSSRSVFLSVMATQDQTTIDFSGFKPGVVFFGTSTSGAPATTSDFSIVLQKNQSYVIGAQGPFSGFTADLNDINGISVKADKPIALATGNWLGGPTQTGHQDIGIDQATPLRLQVNQDGIEVFPDDG